MSIKDIPYKQIYIDILEYLVDNNDVSETNEIILSFGLIYSREEIQNAIKEMRDYGLIEHDLVFNNELICKN